MHSARRGTALLAATTALLVGLVPAASADPPESFTVERTFDDVNVCTGEEHTVTLVFEITERLVGDVTVRTVKGGQTTSDGYVGRGTQTDVRLDGAFVVAFAKWMVVDADTGGRFQVQHDLVVNPVTREVVTDELLIRCVHVPR